MNESSATRDSEALTELGRYPSEREAIDHGLVLLAMGHDFWVEDSPEGCRLLVQGRHEVWARRLLARQARDNQGWPPPAPIQTAAPLHYNPRQLTPLLWCLGLALFFWFQFLTGGQLDAAAAVDPQRIFVDGEWWRLGTALLLHADFGHLLSNAIAGYFAITVLLAVFGPLRGWLWLLLASLLGNLATAAVHATQEHFSSLGASTTVFAALGLLTGQGMLAISQRRWRDCLIPAAAGLGLLALFGSGGQQTDLTAHLGGFVAGLGLGLLAGLRQKASHRPQGTDAA